MKKSIKLVLVVAAIVALPLMAAGTKDESKEKQSLVDFIEYCRTCENLRQVNPAKDYTKASLHELKSAARFYEEQDDKTETDSSMNKQLFYFVFPQSGETITKEMNPLAVKDAAVKYLKTQNEVRGDICIIKNAHEDVVAMAYVSDMMKVSFFTEDETVNDIKPIYVKEEGGEK